MGMHRETKKLLKKNNESEKKILKENDGVYTDMIVYLRGADITEYHQEKVREDLIEMIVSGQERGDDIQKVMGENYKEICEEIIAEMPKKTKAQKVMDIVCMTLEQIWILGIIYIAKSLISVLSSDSKDWHFNITIGEVISGVVIIVVANVIVHYVCKTAFDNEEKKRGKLASFLIIWFVVFLVICAILVPTFVFTKTLLTVHAGIVALVVGIIFIISRVLSFVY